MSDQHTQDVDRIRRIAEDRDRYARLLSEARDTNLRLLAHIAAQEAVIGTLEGALQEIISRRNRLALGPIYALNQIHDVARDALAALASSAARMAKGATENAD